MAMPCNCASAWQLQLLVQTADRFSASEFSVPGGTFVPLPGRDPALPQFYVVDSHPLLAHVQNVHCVYVYVQDTSKTVTQEFYDHVQADTFTLPEGTTEGITQAGM